MDDDAIRGLLVRQPHRGSLPHPPGTVALLRRDLEESGADMPAVERWLAVRSGESRVAPSMRTDGRGRSGWDGPFRYYVIPERALAAPSS